MPTLKAPEGTNSISVGGQHIDVDSDGYVEVDASAIASLLPFGFIVEDKPKSGAKAKKAPAAPAEPTPEPAQAAQDDSNQGEAQAQDPAQP